MYNRLSNLSLAIFTLALTGCASTPNHTNVLMFATTTKMAVDVSVNPVTSATPEITVGYKRFEGVWMPLLVNDVTQNKPHSLLPATTNIKSAACAQANNVNCKFESTAEYDSTGKITKATDTYSVLASIGAKFNGSAASNSDASASGGLSQFFATGLAAQNLTRENGDRLVSVQPVDQKLIKAQQDQITEFQQQNSFLQKHLLLNQQENPQTHSATTLTESESLPNLNINQLYISRSNDILEAVSENGKIDHSTWNKLVRHAKLSSILTNKLISKEYDDQKIRQTIHDDIQFQDAVLTNKLHAALLEKD